MIAAFIRLAKKIPAVRRYQKSIFDKIAQENYDGIENVASILRTSTAIDWERYAVASGCRDMGLDPAFHYVLTGEREGFAQDQFDADFYARRYADAGSTGPNRLLHYVLRGQKEGRYTTATAVETPLPRVPLDPHRPTVFCVLHEASRTGAPILGWNVMTELRKSFFVVAIVLGGGDLMEVIEATVDVAVAIPVMAQDRPAVFAKLAAAYPPSFAVVNGLESHRIAGDLVSHHIPCVLLVQEFGCFYTDEELRALCGNADAIVFASRVIRDGTLDFCPYVDPARAFLQPQGSPVVPPLTHAEIARKSATGPKDDIRTVLRPLGEPRKFLVGGLGTVDDRKGVDLFIATATAIANRRPDLPVKFVWIGHWSKAQENARYSMLIREQLARAGLGDRLAMLPATADIAAVYEEIDVLYLSSRLDPMPNVAIDSAFAQTPVVCFANGTGFAEILQRHDDLKTLVVPYLDVAAAAQCIERLAEDPDWTRALGTSIAAAATAAFDMAAYVGLIEKLGREASERREVDGL